MMFTHTVCVLLAPALAHAAALEWALLEPTGIAVAADNWSPAPTAAARLPGFELFRRQSQEGQGGNTCGFISGLQASSITCSNSANVCATNTLNGVHGCCDPKAMNSCIIPTTCIASTAMSASCTDAACSSNSAVLKCTEATAAECYRWLIIYSRTSMTQHGCTAQGFTGTALRSYGPMPTSVAQGPVVTVTLLATPSSTPTLTPNTDPAKPSLGAIIGGTVGGCSVISIIAIVAFILHRRRKKAGESTPKTPMAQYHTPEVGVVEYDPNGFPTPTLSDAELKWQQHRGPVTRGSDAMPQYPGMGAAQYGIVEVDGRQQAVEVEAESKYYAREYVRSPM